MGRIFAFVDAVATEACTIPTIADITVPWEDEFENRQKAIETDTERKARETQNRMCHQDTRQK